MAFSLLLSRRLHSSKPIFFFSICQNPIKIHQLLSFSSFSTEAAAAAAAESTHQSPKPTSLSARMSFIFDQIDQIDKEREEKHQTLQRIRSWRESNKEHPTFPTPESPDTDSVEDLKVELVKSEELMANGDVKKEVELVHPWPEWIELMERLVEQNYFDHKRKDEDGMIEGLGFDLSDVSTKEMEDKELQLTRDFKGVQTAMVNFGRDRFDILRSLSRQDLQILVGYGCPSADKKVAFSSKLLRKLVHLDEGDVCSSCSLRSSCEKAYLLTNKEDEAQTIDVMRILLAYGFDPIDGSVTNKSLLKMKPVKTVVRKLIHQVVKLSAVPIDPNLPRPVIKRPPPKVKQPPPPPKKRIGRYDVEMKKGDWLCSKCDFLNFAKNTVCLQCDAKRPKRELLPGEWECPQCNFLNYRRNTVCFHCEHKRPPDTYPENKFSDNQQGPRFRRDNIPGRSEVSNAWNFDFDDNESDGADVAAFEHADSHRLGNDFSLGKQTLGENSRGHTDDLQMNRRFPKLSEREYSDSVPMRSGTGFNDFDEEEDDLDSYELVAQNEVPKTSRVNFSELEADSESEDMENNNNNNWRRTSSPRTPTRSNKSVNQKASSLSDSEDEVDFDSDDDLPVHPKWKSSHVADRKQQQRDRGAMSFGSEDDLALSSGSDDENLGFKNKGNRWGSNKVDRAQGRSRSVPDLTDSDDDFGYQRNKQRDNHRKASTARGGMRDRAHGRSHSVPDLTDSDDDFGYNRNKQRDSHRKESTSRGGIRDRAQGRSRSVPDLTDSDDDFGYNRNKQGDNHRKASKSRGGMRDNKTSSLNKDFNRSSGFKRNDRERRGGYDDGHLKNSRANFQSRKQDGSFDKRGGRSNNFDNRSDSFPDDERNHRPRNNVR